MNKGVLFAMPLAAFILSIVDNFESENTIDQITFMQDEMAQLIPELVNKYQIDQLMLVGMENAYTEGIGRQLVNILKNDDIEIIVVIPEEENAKVSN